MYLVGWTPWSAAGPLAGLQNMPELPEVEAVCRNLRKHAIGATISSIHINRPRITGGQNIPGVPGDSPSIERIARRGKNILIHLSTGRTLRIHLRMTGNLYVIPDFRFRPASTSAWFEFTDGRALVFQDTRGLGALTLHTAAEIEQLLTTLGPEPLSRRFTAEALIQSAKRLRQPAKLFLMDQRRVAGLGNIYAAEALFAARINPRKPIGDVSRAKLKALHAAILAILRDAVKSATRAYSRPGAFSEAESFTPAVYGRAGERCHTCRAVIRRITQGGRSTYYCPRCQR